MEPPLYDNNITLRENSHEAEVSNKEDMTWSGLVIKSGKVFAVKNDFVSRPKKKKRIMNKRVKVACALEQSFSKVNGHTNRLGMLWETLLGMQWVLNGAWDSAFPLSAQARPVQQWSVGSCRAATLPPTLPEVCHWELVYGRYLPALLLERQRPWPGKWPKPIPPGPLRIKGLPHGSQGLRPPRPSVAQEGWG